MLQALNLNLNLRRAWNSANSSRSTSAGWPCGRASAGRVTTTTPIRPALACASWSTVDRYRNGRELWKALLSGAACGRAGCA